MKMLNYLNTKPLKFVEKGRENLICFKIIFIAKAAKMMWGKMLS
jgi:hypothetical protein